MISSIRQRMNNSLRSACSSLNFLNGLAQKSVFFVFTFLLLISLASTYSGAAISAEPPTIITYQGKLISSGSSVTTSIDMGFMLYDASTGGSMVYTASGTLGSTSTISVTPVSGIFSVDLGDGSTNVLSTSIFNTDTLYLEVWIDGTPMSPRKRLTALPYAINSSLLNGVAATSTPTTTSYIPISNSDGSFTFNTTTAAYLFATTVSTTDLYVDGAVNGISSTDLDDASNIGYLDGDQTFTGINSFSASTTFSTATIDGLIISDNITIGGVTRTSWPSDSGVNYWTSSTGRLFSNTLSDVLLVGTSTTSTADSIFEVSGNSQFNGDTYFLNQGAGFISGGTDRPILAVGNPSLGKSGAILVSGDTSLASTSPYLSLIDSNTAVSRIFLGPLGLADTLSLGEPTAGSYADIYGYNGLLEFPRFRFVASTTLGYDSYFKNNILFGASTDTALTVGGSGFVLDGNDVYIDDLLGVRDSLYVQNQIFSTTNTAVDFIASSSITLGGVQRTTWPSGAGSGVSPWVTSTGIIYQDSLTDVVLIGANTTSTSAIFEVTGDSNLIGDLTVDSGALFVDASTNRVGVNTITPGYDLTVSGTMYVSGTSTFVTDIQANGKNIGKGGGTNSNNIAFGALYNNTTGQYNAGFGALYSNTEGSFNVGMSYGSLGSNTTGSGNTAIGANTLNSNVSGSDNSAFGRNALDLSTGSDNSAFGVNALGDLATGQDNTAIGSETGAGIVNGSYNTILGAGVSGLSSSLSNNVIISDGQGNQRIRILSNGYVGINTTTPGYQFTIEGNSYFSGTSTINNNLFVGALAESITTSSFVMNGDDAYIHDLLGIGDSLYVENAIHIGTSSLHLSGDVSGGIISMTNGPLSILSEGILSLNSTGTTTANEFLATALTLNGERRTTWPSDAGSAVTPWVTSSGKIYQDTLTDVVLVGANTSSTDAILEVTGDTSLLGDVYVTGTTRFTNGLTTLEGKVSNPTQVGSLANGAGGALLDEPRSVFVSGDYAYVASAGSNALEIVSISDPTNATHIGSLANGVGGALLNYPTDVFVSGDYAYVTSFTSDALEIVNISDPANPVHVGSIADGEGGALFDGPTALDVSGDYAYVVSQNSDSLEIVNISDPTNPAHVGSIVDGAGGALLEGANGVVISGNYAYVVSISSDALEIVDISDPANPAHVGSIADGAGGAELNGAIDVDVSGNYAYVASIYSDALEIVDISDPASPTHAGSLLDNAGGAQLNGAGSITISGNYAYIVSVSDKTLEIVDISDPTSPTHVGALTSVLNSSMSSKISVSGNYVYVGADAGNTLNIIDVSGATISNAEIGTAKIDNLQANNNVYFDKSLNVHGRLYVGNDGLLLSGDFAINAPTSSLSATNTLRFSHTTLFESVATSSDDNIFVFDTKNTFSDDKNIFSIRNGGSEGLTVLGNGYLGLASSTPNYRLTVDGQSYVTGTSTAGEGNQLAYVTNSGIGGYRVSSFDSGATLDGSAGVFRAMSSNENIGAAFVIYQTSTTTVPTMNTTPAGTLAIDTNNNAALNLGHYAASDNNSAGSIYMYNGTSSLPSAYFGFAVDSFINNNFLIGTTSSQTMTTSGFSMDGDDAYVADLLGVKGSIFVENAIHIGTSSLHLSGDVSGGIISMTNGPLSILSDGILTLNSTGTTTANEFVASAFTLNGERRTTWPSEGGTASFTDGGGYLYPVTSSYSLAIGTSTEQSEQFYVDGDVGISGTTTITNKLLVEGKVRNPVELGTLKDATDFEGAEGIAISGDYAYMTSYYVDSLSIIDISDPTSSTVVGTVTYGVDGTTGLNGAIDVAVSGNYAYVAAQSDDSLSIIDISDPTNPIEVGTIKDGVDGATGLNGANGVVVAGNYAYVSALSDDSLSIIDISDPTNPIEVGTIVDGVGATSLDGANGVVVSGNYAYLTAQEDASLSIIDISDPTNPIEVGTIVDGVGATRLDGAWNLDVSGSYAYVVSYIESSLSIIDISDPANPTEVGTIARFAGASEFFGARDVEVSGNYAYVASWNDASLSVIDISDPANPTEVGTIVDGEGATELSGAAGVVVAGNYAYVTAKLDDSLSIIDISGTTISNADIGTARIDRLQVMQDTLFDQSLNVRGGLSVGSSGFLLSGDFGISAATSSLSATNTLRFSHTALFDSTVPSADTQAFLFNTRNTLDDTSTLFGVQNDTNEYLTILGNGNIGINTTTPGYQLTVDGYMWVAGTTTFESSVFLGSNSEISFTTDGDHTWDFDHTLNIVGADGASIILSDEINFASVSAFDSGVAIGTTTEAIGSEKLFVNGNTTITGTADVGGVTVAEAGGITILDGTLYAKNNEGILPADFDVAFLLGNVYVGSSTESGLDGTGFSMDGDDLFVLDEFGVAGGTYLTTTTIGGKLDVNNFVEIELDSAIGGSQALCSNKGSGEYNNIEIVDCTSGPSDMAEFYETELDVESGDIVMTTDKTITYEEELFDILTGSALRADNDTSTSTSVLLKDQKKKQTTIAVLGKANKVTPNSIVGIVSTNPYQVLGGNIKKYADHPQPIAITGRVPTKVNLENGPVAIGDAISLSGTAGVGMKALAGDITVGIALEPYTGSGSNKIMVAIMPGQFGLLQKIEVLETQINEVYGALSAEGGENITIEVNTSNGTLGYIHSDLNLNGNNIFGVQSISGFDGKWRISAEGLVISTVETTKGSKDLYALQSEKSEIVLSGSGILENGVSIIEFDEVYSEIIDSDELIKITVTLTDEANGVYVSEKSATGFIVNELASGSSNATFDWVAIVYRKMSQSTTSQVDEEDTTENNQNNTQTNNGAETTNTGGESATEESGDTTTESDTSDTTTTEEGGDVDTTNPEGESTTEESGDTTTESDTSDTTTTEEGEAAGTTNTGGESATEESGDTTTESDTSDTTTIEEGEAAGTTNTEGESTTEESGDTTTESDTSDTTEGNSDVSVEVPPAEPETPSVESVEAPSPAPEAPAPAPAPVSAPAPAPVESVTTVE